MKRRNFIATTVAATLTGGSLISEANEFKSIDKPRSITNKTSGKTLKPLYVPADNSPTFRRATKIRFDQTNNQFSCVERIVPPKTMGPAPHVHNDLDEIMRVLKGTVAVLVGKEVTYVEEGAWHLRPHGIVHTFWNESSEPAHVLEFYPNQNFDVFLEEFNKLMAEFKSNGVSPTSKDAIRRIDELEGEWGVISYHDQREPLMKKYGLI
jgi:mannose-6-phosphate isomerase-like protein (cupin superfamily)